MSEKQTLRSKLFGLFFKSPKKEPPKTEYVTTGGKPWVFEDVKKEENSTYQNCASCLANHVSLIRPKCFTKGEPSQDKRWLDRIIGLRPNPINTASDFYYTLARDYFMYGIAIAHLEYGPDGYLQYMTPVDQESIRISRSGRDLFLKCSCSDGQEVQDSLEGFLVLIRKANARNPMLQLDPSMDKVIKVLNTNCDAFAKAMVESQFIRYVCKLASVTDEAKKKKIRDSFSKQLEESGSGLLIVDGVVDFKEMSANSAVYAHQPELENFEGEVYSSFGVTKEFVQGKYTPDEYDAVYRSSIQPFIKRLSEEMTYKIFTEKEIGYGNEIRIETSQLETASMETRIKVAQTIIQGSMYTANEIRRLMYLPIIEGGDKVIQSLNYVNADKADSYQEVGDDEDKQDDAEATKTPASGEEDEDTEEQQGGKQDADN